MPYIIERELKVNGVFKKFFHNKLELCTNKSVMNVYSENVESDKKKALRFYDRDEADKLAVFLANEYSRSTVKSISK